MNRILEVCLAALALAAPAFAADGSEMAGTWEGQIQGIRAVTLEIQGSAGSLAGSATFYVIKDEGDRKRVGGETRVEMEHVRFQAGTLEFEVSVAGGDAVRFLMTIKGRDAAELKRVARGEMPELTVGLRRQIEL